MAMQLFTEAEEPDDEAPVWRFIEFWKFDDLLTTGKLYLRRSDRLADEHEGIPPEEYVRMSLGLSRYSILDIETCNHHLGTLAQDRQAFYVNCWYLFQEETAFMWGRYGNDGVAIVSRYSALKRVLEAAPERFYVGLVRYGWEYGTRYNVQRFITTKRSDFETERELRLGVWRTDIHDGGNRHIDIDNRVHPRPVYAAPSQLVEGIKRSIDLPLLVSEVVLNPFADSTFASKVREVVKARLGDGVRVRESDLARHSRFVPSAEELRQYGFDTTPLSEAPDEDLPSLPEAPG